MKKVCLIIMLAFIILGGWVSINYLRMVRGWFYSYIDPNDNTDVFINEINEVANLEDSKGCLVYTLVENQKEVHTGTWALDNSLDENSLFQLASLSKWFTAWGVMKLVESEKINLDQPISQYLTRWSLPPHKYNEEVTIRRLLSHTAGLVDGLGYAGFENPAEVQSLEESLTRAADSWNSDPRVRVGKRPGSGWKYSGGGYTLLQLIIEEVSGKDFNSYMEDEILIPLGMKSSTFVLQPPQKEDLVPFFNSDGEVEPDRYYTATGAASLYSTKADLVKFVMAHFPGPDGEPRGRNVISPETLDLMTKPHAELLGDKIWGLGTILYSEVLPDQFLFGHDGSNTPDIYTAVRINPLTGDALIVLSSGHYSLYQSIVDNWNIWQGGGPGLLSAFTNPNISFLIISTVLIAVLYTVIVIIIWLKKRKCGDN